MATPKPDRTISWAELKSDLNLPEEIDEQTEITRYDKESTTIIIEFDRDLIAYLQTAPSDNFMVIIKSQRLQSGEWHWYTKLKDGEIWHDP